MRTVADLLVPTASQQQRIPRAPWLKQQRLLLDTVRLFVSDPRLPQREKLRALACAVVPVAQCQLMLGCCPAVAIEHAAELLESMFLADALSETPGLVVWFGE